MQHARSSSVALVTTVWLASQRNAPTPAATNGEGATLPTRHTDVLSAFLLYHLGIGVAKIFVFFDGDEQSQLRVKELHPQVQAHCAASRVELRYSSSSSDGDGDSNDLKSQYERYCVNNLSKFRDVLHKDVAARQMLNAELAMRLCLEHNDAKRIHKGDDSNDQPQRIKLENARQTAIGELRWLLHLDVDELLYLDAFPSTQKPTQALTEYVTNLEMQHQADQMTLLNYEAIPTQVNGANYFTSATKFRKHYARIPLSSQAQCGIAFWQQRTKHSQFFLFYDNGKSIVRITDHAVPLSVHHWQVTSDTSTSFTTSSKSNFYDARRNFAQEDVVQESIGQRACILHYPVCGLEWLYEKYERLGEFPDVWGGTSGEKEMKILPCFHTQARDALVEYKKRLKKKKTSEPKEALEELYRSHVMLDMDAVNVQGWQAQVDAGVCEEIHFVAQVLAKFGFPSSRVDNHTRLDGVTSATARKIGAQESFSGATIDSTSALASTSAPSSNSVTTDFTTEKAWMLASISQQYL